MPPAGAPIPAELSPLELPPWPPGEKLWLWTVADTGGVTIDKSVAVIAKPGEHVAVAPTVGSAVIVDAPGEEVVLRGLYLNGKGAGWGVFINATASAVHVENLVIANFPNSGIYVQRSPTSLLPPCRVYVTGSTIRQNLHGLEPFGSSGLETELLIDQTIFTSNFLGLFLTRGRGSISRSVISGTREDFGVGIAAYSGSQLTVEQCTISMNKTAIDEQDGDRFAGYVGSVGIQLHNHSQHIRLFR